MKVRMMFAAVLSAIVFSFSAVAQTAEPSVTSESLVNLLPASSAVVSIDVQKGLNDALPKLLGGNPQLKAEVDKGLAMFSTKAGADALKFSDVVVGVGVQEVPGAAPKILPVFIGRGDVNAAQVVATAMAASKTPCAEQVVSGKTVYICQMEVSVKIPAKTAGAAGSGKVLKETAFVALDANTIASGAVSRVIETIERRSSVNPTLKGLLKRSPTTVAAFSMENVNGLEKIIPLENDDVGNALKSLRFMAGSADSVADGFVFNGLFRSADPASSKQLGSLFSGLQAIGKAFLGNSNRADQKMYARLINSVKITQAGNDVSLSIALPQADVNTLMAGVKLPPK
ncbi:MAG TPA: hypothetical protein PLR83_02115 [Pyrinomonadaceae bacterium]|nr:hypothetical protein [Pyrinomonadaceae bacterium]